MFYLLWELSTALEVRIHYQNTATDSPDEDLLTTSHSTIKLLPTLFFYGKHIVLPLQLFLQFFIFIRGGTLLHSLCAVPARALFCCSTITSSSSASFFSLLFVLGLPTGHQHLCLAPLSLLSPFAAIVTNLLTRHTRPQLMNTPAVACSPPAPLPPCVVHLRPVHRAVFSQDDDHNFILI